MEPNATETLAAAASAADPGTSILVQVFALFLAAVAYYLGAYIRNVVQPAQDVLPFKKQVLMGVPLFLILAAVLLTTLQASFGGGSTMLAQVIAVLVIFIQNGIIMNEAWSKFLNNLIQGEANN